MTANTYLGIPTEVGSTIVRVARQCLTLTLFFIGAGLSRATLRTVGVRPFMQGIALWFFIGAISLTFVCLYY